jgi:sec-independent protein translocase protein TatB
MFNIGTGEIALIAVVALLVLGPKRLPELARGIGKFMREFRRQTDEVRGVVEREFYKMDQELELKEPPLQVHSAHDAVAVGQHEELAVPLEASQLTAGMPQGEPVSAAPTEPSAPIETAHDPQDKG